MSSLEVISFVISIIGVWLTIKRKIWCWPVNFIAYGLYAKLFYDYKLYGETFLQFAFMVLAVYGFWTWAKQSDSEIQAPIRVLQAKTLIQHVIFSIVLGVLLGLSLHQMSDASIPYLDAQLVTMSLVITYWTSKKYLQIWPAWILVNCIYVMMFLYKSLFLTALLYAVFIVLACLGYKQWTKTYQLQQQQIQSK